ncbi:hypothetical protein [Coralloluteibacterium stylophorae]|uniref:Uncharacterized protein n=1 Tax=Coralloluteibacterium stylophorae TaxID=1776034 RepID=A0A8J7VSC0_9GAMM|nr:hypothetical protein [Coralloluteibacterium stylophorae]MBS7456920.1 hypothetical protein [Coralloluteibacterium stylophorae]
MDKFVALLQFVLALFGVDVAGSTYVARATVDGVDTLHARAVVEAGVARFECLRSASGHCHYVVWPSRCDGPASCDRGPLQRFVLASGDSRQVAGLHRFRLCVTAEDAAAGTACAQVEDASAP